MSFWKPLIDWNASHKFHAGIRSEAKLGVGIGIRRPNGSQGDSLAELRQDAPPASLPIVAPGDIHGAF